MIWLGLGLRLGLDLLSGWLVTMRTYFTIDYISIIIVTLPAELTLSISTGTFVFPKLDGVFRSLQSRQWVTVNLPVTHDPLTQKKLTHESMTHGAYK